MYNKKFGIKTNQPLILASKSQIRYMMLKNVGLKFQRIFSEFDESSIKKRKNRISYYSLALRLASEKAKKISYKYPNSYVIGADQICIFEKEIISKPKTKEKAIEQLKKMQDKEHLQVSAFSIYHNKALIGEGYDQTVLKMRKLSMENIKKYIDKDRPLKSCGSYKYEENGYLLFSNVQGNHDNIKGLPLIMLLDMLFKKKVISYE